MDDIQQFRSQVIAALAAATDGEGRPRLTESQVRKLGRELTDDEIADGMLFNTPDEVAELLLDSGLQ